MPLPKTAADIALANSPLGRPTSYPDRYQPDLLFPIARAPQREPLGLIGTLPFDGADFWTAYEMAWLDLGGKPRSAVLNMSILATSPAIVESKSLKLYLGSFAQEIVASEAALCSRIEADLSRICGAAVGVWLVGASALVEWCAQDLQGESVDELEATIDRYEPDADFLSSDGPAVSESLRSAVFKSNCPVTGQPDYADVQVHYHGPRIDRPGLLKYIVSYRQHSAFHEACVERMFMDIQRRCRPSRLTVYARFLRRGGIDINPFRSNFEAPPLRPARTPRQ